jgi:hypothetical protein
MIINDEWELETDELNVILKHKRSKLHHSSKPNSPASYEYFYYGTIAGALASFVEKEIKSTKLKELQIISDKIEVVKQDIYKALGKLSKIP